MRPLTDQTCSTDMPAAYHNKTSMLLFADGHSQNRKWSDRQVVAQAAISSPLTPSRMISVGS